MSAGIDADRVRVATGCKRAGRDSGQRACLAIDGIRRNVIGAAVGDVKELAPWVEGGYRWIGARRKRATAHRCQRAARRVADIRRYDVGGGLSAVGQSCSCE